MIDQMDRAATKDSYLPLDRQAYSAASLLARQGAMFRAAMFRRRVLMRIKEIMKGCVAAPGEEVIPDSLLRESIERVEGGALRGLFSPIRRGSLRRVEL
jgi:hypothetical protein